MQGCTLDPRLAQKFDFHLKRQNHVEIHEVFMLIFLYRKKKHRKNLGKGKERMYFESWSNSKLSQKESSKAKKHLRSPLLIFKYLPCLII